MKPIEVYEEKQYNFISTCSNCNSKFLLKKHEVVSLFNIKYVSKKPCGSCNRYCLSTKTILDNDYEVLKLTNKI